MTDEELLIAFIEDKINMCENNYMLTYTNFLDLNQQSMALKFLSKIKNVRYEFYGGFSDCERKILMFLPDYITSSEYFTENPDSSPIVQIKIIKDNFSSLSHRDYLGAIMALGIKRGMLGDLVITDCGCVTAAMRNIANYISENLTSVGRGTIKIEISDSFDNDAGLSLFEEKRCYVSSMRIDSVVAAVFGMARTASVEKIRRCEVFLNDVAVEKADTKVPFNSKIVVRGRGKAIIKSDEGITKKGRQAFIAKIFK